ncbi:hypothetical protein SY88_04385 [Clostridiales bacterium PH28_bin88]|nr:hypothetical protein SY88_04385 [Clostridiales bacterium PH28_bin88]
MIRAMVVDDEVLSRDELKYLLEVYPEIEVCGEAANGESALELFNRLRPDVVFLDIQMPGVGGLAVARVLMQEQDPPVVVFATAYDQHAIEAFELNAMDYLLKPFSEERLDYTVQRLKRNVRKKDHLVERLERLVSKLESGVLHQGAPVKLAVEAEERLVLLSHPDVAYAYVEGRHVYLKTRERTYRSGYSMQELESKLPTPPFFRCHRGYLVNMDWVKEIHPWFNGAYQLVLDDKENSEVPVSRLSVKEMRSLLNI